MNVKYVKMNIFQYQNVINKHLYNNVQNIQKMIGIYVINVMNKI